MMLALRAGPVLAATVKLIVCGPVPLAGMPVTQVGTSLVFHVQTELVEIAYGALSARRRRTTGRPGRSSNCTLPAAA